MRLTMILSAGLLAAVPALSARQAVLNPKARLALDLDGKWNAIVDPYDIGFYDYRLQRLDAAPNPRSGFFLDRVPASKSELVEYSFDHSPMLTVPKDWNSQDARLQLYEGAVWYRRLFDFTAKPGTRVFLHIGAANYESQVYLNGKKLGEHTGGFTPYDLEMTGLLKPAGNSLVVRVDNRRHREGVPTINTDWWNYGGLTREVYLFTTPQTLLSHYTVRLQPGDPTKIEVLAELDGAQLQQEVTVSIPELHLAVSAPSDEQGRVRLVANVPADLQRWAPEHPKRYAVHVKCASDEVIENIGFRTIEVKGSDILLNGQPIFLRGICLHEENPMRGGRAYSREDAQLLLGWAKELNCNFMRLAHYPHNENMAQLADELGLLLWEEIPVYWTIQWENPATLQNARQQLNDLIVRDHNRASVIIWSVANETPPGEARTNFLRQLVADARALDGSRLVSAAMEVRTAPDNPHRKIVDDPFGEFTDILSFNEYVGWYDGTHESIPQVEWSLKYNKPVVITEFGADALQGYHADNLTRFSEEYQAEVYRKTVPMLRKIPELRGMSPWILCDFRSPRRLLPNIQDGWNRKGLIGENGVKKEAFSVLAGFYAELLDQGYVRK
ncbi:MAG TPA: glycoside hydrolase family 2 TIM barrel-domain containing protein [Opitutaceae bacterium]|nr:glycoside hydrolase family 2 TIM barrel-domain containing protein [Opitutaceae bacterium]